MEVVVHEGVDGDVLEAGLWRGGASIYSVAVLQKALVANGWPRDPLSTASGEPSKPRVYYAADSFSGLPGNSTSHDISWWGWARHLRVSLPDVMEAFSRYLPSTPLLAFEDVVDATKPLSVKFIPGYVRETAPVLKAQLEAEGSNLACLRIDVDMYEAYMDLLFNLAPKVSPGGFFVMDDYSCSTLSAPCRASLAAVPTETSSHSQLSTYTYTYTYTYTHIHVHTHT